MAMRGALSRVGAALALLTLSNSAAPAKSWHLAPRLTVEEAGTPQAWISWRSADGTVGPAYGYGLSPQNILTNLPPGDARDPDLDFRDFAEWAEESGVTIVRSYPPSRITGPRWLDAFVEVEPGKFDLTQFNDDYFRQLAVACRALSDRGVAVHLQCWQAVVWKKNWEGCYYHPDNNVNPELAKNAGPGQFVIDPERNPALIAHQQAWIRRLLDATAPFGNVFYDVMNEIGNGTGVNGDWVEAMLDAVDVWEAENGPYSPVLVGLNDEGQDRASTGWSISNARMEIAFLDLGRYDQHVEARQKFHKPTFGVRNIDWNPKTKQRRYFAIEDDLTINPDPAFRSRSRRMFWRMFMAGVQMNAGYADWGRQAYRNAPGAADRLPGYGELNAFRGGVENVEFVQQPAPAAFGRAGDGQTIVLLEATPGESGVQVAAGPVELRVPAEAVEDVAVGAFEVSFLPLMDDGLAPRFARATVDVERGEGGWSLCFDAPAFTDGLIAHVHSVDVDGVSWRPEWSWSLPEGYTEPRERDLVPPTVQLIRTRHDRAILWAKGNFQPASYEWQRRPAGEGDFVTVATTDAPYLNDWPLETGRRLEYRVRAGGGEGDGGWTAWSGATGARPSRADRLGQFRHVLNRWPEVRNVALAAMTAFLLTVGWFLIRASRRKSA